MIRTPRTAASAPEHAPDRSPARVRRPLWLIAAPLALALAGAALTAGCAGDEKTPAAAGTPAPTGPAVTITDPWVKTAPSGMTAVFGTLANGSDRPVTVLSGTSTAAKTVELHEVAMAGGAMVMRPKAGGFVVPARGSHQLAPGADHIMLLGLTAPVRPGDRVPLTLTLDGGATVSFTAVAKDFAGGKENYQPGHGTPSAGASGAAGTGGGTGMTGGRHG